MTNRNMSRRRGNALLEMSMVCIPLLCSFLAIFELSRALWTYHTLAQAIKGGARYAVVHGARCADASSACTASVGDIALVIGQTGVGLDASALRLTLAAGGQSVSCASMSACTGDHTPLIPLLPIMRWDKRSQLRACTLSAPCWLRCGRIRKVRRFLWQPNPLR